ncbi:hypothetical protein GPECTOR_3g306 [Gonium pectorale]|uniref:Uncharacterized protein n=1 Tax=Gonium pectorale TaxID=33097 RepID=A0A150GZV8_GONPE|nr:hypothetical protein GPECTOR_3g306 [Gonium pectorale]|eukprot:KXZ55158.1 hypothetical protein GPECTOR_3g306 [Gonium pectorale]
MAAADPAMRIRRGGMTARIADCGVRRLALGGAWRAELEAHAELRACAAPELLAGPPGVEVQWAPSHDMYS